MTMFNRALKNQLSELLQSSQQDQALLNGVQQHCLYAEYDVRGALLWANPALAAKLGRTPDELTGIQHRELCLQTDHPSSHLRELWQALGRGEPQTICLEHSRQGATLWLESNFIPVEVNGAVDRVIQIATDVTEQRVQNAQSAGTIAALNRSMAVIEFTPTGRIVTANDNFLAAVGYSLEDIQGKHHEIFCTSEFYQSHPDFWRELAQGSFKSGRFERRTASGEVLWLEATYNPLFDANGQVEKVVKFASDITARVLHAQQVANAAQVANTSARETSNTAAEGSQLLENALQNFNNVNRQVSDTVELINQLNQQSSQIEAIASTITAIAEQTNLLALNAAIEAARAGELGRGFAVVADEVRQLAARTSQSTTEIEKVVKHNHELTQAITTQVESVSQSVEDGSKLNQDVARVIEQIQLGADEVSQTVANLALEKQ